MRLKVIMKEVKNISLIKIGRAVRDLRLKKGLTQADLAFKTGLHRTYIGSVEMGRRNVSLQNIEEIAKSLDTLPSELLKEAQL